MLFILVVVELASGIAQMASLGVAVGLKNVPRFQKNLQTCSSGSISSWRGRTNSDLLSISIDALKPITQLLVPMCIVQKRPKRVNDDVHTLPVCETLQESPDLVDGVL